MKYVLILYVCSFMDITNPSCSETHVVPLEFKDYQECILQGYKSAHNTLKEFYSDRIENEKLAIKFNCQAVQVEEKV